MACNSGLPEAWITGVNPKIACADAPASKPLVKGLQDGEIDALVVQDPYKMGYMAVEVLVKHLKGEKVDPLYDTGVKVVTKKDLNDPQIRALLGLK